MNSHLSQTATYPSSASPASVCKWAAGIVGALFAIAGFVTPVQAADNYPNRTITMIVPYTAGSPPDLYSRLYAERLQAYTGQNVIIENRPGANTTIGTTHVARAQPDGYTIMYGSNSSLAAAPALFRKLAYDPLKDLTAIGVTYRSPMVLVVRPEDAKIGVPAMLERIRKDPKNNPVGGGASTQEALNRMIANAAGLDHEYVRYGGTGLIQDLIGGRLAIAISAIAGVKHLVDDGQVGFLAVSGQERLATWPDLPTVNETLPGVTIESWIGIWAPAGTPKPIIDYLHKATTQIIQEPVFKKRNDDAGAVTVLMTPEESNAFVAKEIPRGAKLLKDAGIEPQ